MKQWLVPAQVVLSRGEPQESCGLEEVRVIQSLAMGAVGWGFSKAQEAGRTVTLVCLLQSSTLLVLGVSAVLRVRSEVSKLCWKSLF